MKKIVDMMAEGGGEPRVDQYLFVFLKCANARLARAAQEQASNSSVTGGSRFGEVPLCPPLNPGQVHGVHHSHHRIRPHDQRQGGLKRAHAGICVCV